MDILPRDLGMKRYLAVLRRRTRAHLLSGFGYDPFESVPTQGRPRTRRGPLSRMWTRGLNLNDAESVQAAAVMTEQHRGMSVAGNASVGVIVGSILMLPIGAAIASGEPTLAILAGAGWFGIAASVLSYLPKSVLQRLHTRPITPEELQALRLTTMDRLERSYLSLIMEAVKRDIPAPVQADIRDALRSLGEATMNVPSTLPTRDLDPGKLLSDAHALRTQAQRENDPTIAASLNRQADTLERRADVAGEADAPAARRRQVIREELRLQMDTLRASLVALETGNANRVEVASLAASVQRVAAGTAAVAAARNELDDEAIQELSGVTIKGTPSTPQENRVPLQWWRGG